VNVLGPKWIKAINSFFKASYWLTVGTTCAAFRIMESLVSVSLIAIVLETGIARASGPDFGEQAVNREMMAKTRYWNNLLICYTVIQLYGYMAIRLCLI